MNIIFVKYWSSYNSLWSIHLDNKLDRVVNSGRFQCERMHLCLSIWWHHKAEGNECRRWWVWKTMNTENNKHRRWQAQKMTSAEDNKHRRWQAQKTTSTEGNKHRRQWTQKIMSTEGNKGSRCICFLLITWLFFGCGPETFHTNSNCTCCKPHMADDSKWCYIVQSIKAFMNWNTTLYFSSSPQQWDIQWRKIYCKY